MKFSHVLLTLTASAALLTTACDDDDPILEEENEEEVITDVTLTLIGEDPQATRTFTFVDDDGEGGDPGVLTAADLAADTEYDYTITFFNRLANEDVTTEVREEGNEHQVFFFADGIELDFEYSDAANEVDSVGRPIGLAGTVTTGQAGTGDMTVILLHEPDKDGIGVMDGDTTNAGGSTDVNITFEDVVVE